MSIEDRLVQGDRDIFEELGKESSAEIYQEDINVPLLNSDEFSLGEEGEICPHCDTPTQLVYKNGDIEDVLARIECPKCHWARDE